MIVNPFEYHSPILNQGHVLRKKAKCHSGYQGVLGILFPTESHPEAPRGSCGSHGALLPAQAILIHPKIWCVHTTKLSRPSCSTVPLTPLVGGRSLYPISFTIKGVIAVYNWISLLVLLVDQIPPWNNQLQFSWMKAMTSFASLHNYLLQPYQILS